MIEYHTGLRDTNEIRAYTAQTLERLGLTGWTLIGETSEYFDNDGKPVLFAALSIEFETEEDALMLQLQYPTFKDAIIETLLDPTVTTAPGWLF